MSKIVTTDDLFRILGRYEDRFDRLERANFWPRTTPIEFASEGAAPDARLRRSAAGALTIDRPDGTSATLAVTGAATVGGTLTVTGTATVNGQAVVLTNDSRLSDARTPTGSASGGDLAGTYPTSVTLFFRNGTWLTSREGAQRLNFSTSGPSYLKSGDNRTFIRRSNDSSVAEFNDEGIHLHEGWFRTYNSTGWYNQTFAGGWYMVDTSWIRNYNNKWVYLNTAQCRTDANFNGNYMSTGAPNVGPYTFRHGSAWDMGVYSGNQNAWGYIYAAGYPGTSDRRLKENIRLVSETEPEGVLTKLRRIKAVKFAHRGFDAYPDGVRPSDSYSLIADEVEQEFPDLIANMQPDYDAPMWSHNFGVQDWEEEQKLPPLKGIFWNELISLVHAGLGELADDHDITKDKAVDLDKRLGEVLARQQQIINKQNEIDTRLKRLEPLRP